MKPQKLSTTWEGGSSYRQVVELADGTSSSIAGETASTIEYYTGASQGMAREYEMCGICGAIFPKDRFRYYQGKPYCVPNGCHTDIRQLIRKGRD